MDKQNDPAKDEPKTEPEPKDAQTPASEPEPSDPDEGGDGPDDPHGQPGISKGKYQREMKAKDEEIEKLKAQLDELSKTAEGREKLQKQIDDLKSQLQSDATDYQLKLAGCKNTKAAKALLEVANSVCGGEWPVSDKAWNSLVNLCVDICKRDGIPKLTYTGDSPGTLTEHRMFAATDCPGTYLHNRMQLLADTVNACLGSGGSSGSSGSGSSSSNAKSYTVTASAGLNVRSGARTSYSKVTALAKGATVSVTETKVSGSYTWGKLADGSGWVALDYTSWPGSNSTIIAAATSTKTSTKTYAVTAFAGLNVRKGAGTSYSVVKTLSLGASVSVTETKANGSYTWGKLSDGSGWVALECTTWASGFSTGTYKVTASSGLNVRKGAGTSYAKVKAIACGTKVSVTDITVSGSYVWGKTSDGWICLKEGGSAYVAKV